MNTMNSATPLSDVLYEFSLAQPTPDAELLDQFVRQYPEYAAALTDLAIGIVLDMARGDDDEAAGASAPMTSPAVSRAMSRFQNKLFEVQQRVKNTSSSHHATPSISNPFAMLTREEFRALANGLNGNTVFVGMLRDREIEPNTMTDGFTRLVASEMKAPIELVAAHFAGQSEVGGRQYYKAETKPSAGRKLTFAEAVRKSGLTEEQQKYLLSL